MIPRYNYLAILLIMDYSQLSSYNIPITFVHYGAEEVCYEHPS